MNMNSKKKLITLITSIALIAAIGVGATLAYLTATTGTVTNTFTVGSYAESALDIFEHKATLDKDSGSYVAATGAAEVKENTYANVLPGTTLDKDPTMRLVKDSPSSFLVIKATGLKTLPATVTDDMNTSAWKDITASVGDTNTANTYYIYCPAKDGAVNYITATDLANDDVTTAPLFNKLTVAPSFDGTSSINDLTFQGCAVQYSSAMGSDYVAAVVAALPTGFVG